MDTIPTQGTHNKMPHIQKNVWMWALGIVLAIIVLWLWVSWSTATFPFATQNRAQNTAQTRANLLRSLTPTNTHPAPPSQSVLNSLTPTNPHPAPPSQSVLDSLTAK